MRCLQWLVQSMLIMKSMQTCSNPEAEDGHQVTEGCLTKTCKSSVWRSSLISNMCCYERKPYTINTTISYSLSKDGCAKASVDCVEETSGNAKMVLSVKNFCEKYASMDQLEEIKQILNEKLEAGSDCQGENVEANDDKEGILISGSVYHRAEATSVEVFSPTTGHHCVLPSLPKKVNEHTSNGLELCSGFTCITFSSGQWVTSHALVERRGGHISWSTDTGVMLMGGDEPSDRSTETIIQGEYDGQPGYRMKYKTWKACSIPDRDSVIITGGRYTMSTVSRYGTRGHLGDLPSLNQGRRDHGCGAYTDDSGDQVYLVAGGYLISSTEILTRFSSAWVVVRSLPRKIFGLKGVTLGGKLYLLGGGDEIIMRDEIYQWTGHEWIEVGKMKKGRYYHAVSTIKMDKRIMDFCN